MDNPKVRQTQGLLIPEGKHNLDSMRVEGGYSSSNELFSMIQKLRFDLLHTPTSGHILHDQTLNRSLNFYGLFQISGSFLHTLTKEIRTFREELGNSALGLERVWGMKGPERVLFSYVEDAVESPEVSSYRSSNLLLP